MEGSVSCDLFAGRSECRVLIPESVFIRGSFGRSSQLPLNSSTPPPLPTIPDPGSHPVTPHFFYFIFCVIDRHTTTIFPPTLLFLARHPLVWSTSPVSQNPFSFFFSFLSWVGRRADSMPSSPAVECVLPTGFANLLFVDDSRRSMSAQACRPPRQDTWLIPDPLLPYVAYGSTLRSSCVTLNSRSTFRRWSGRLWL